MRGLLQILLTVAISTAAQAVWSENAGNVYVHTEFLWEPADPDSLARSWAQGLLLDEAAEHQICLKLTGHPEEGQAVRIQVYDGAGEHVATDDYHHPGGPHTRIRCRSAQTHHTDGAPGTWTYRTTLSSGHVGSDHVGNDHESVSRIEVASELSGAGFYSNPVRPYIVGRTNYSDSVAEHYRGEVVFDMTVNEAGRVVDSQLVRPDELPAAIADRVRAAARLYRFPPDPDRRQKPLVVRQSLSLSNEVRD